MDAGTSAGRVVHDDGVLRIVATGRGGLALTGEIDEETYPALTAALARSAAGRDVVHLDLGGLDYCDLAGLRAMIQLAGPAPGPGRRVVLHGVRPGVRTVLAVLGWDEIPGVAIAGSGR